MGDRAAEKAIFEFFVKTLPNFAGESLREWVQPSQDPPDVCCVTVSGQRIGIELGEWLNQSQITRAKGLEAIEESIVTAIGPQPDNDLGNIYFGWIHARPRVRVKPADTQSFRSEIFALAREIDSRWESEPAWWSPQGVHYDDFARYPVVGKYLTAITFFPRLHYVGWPPHGQMQKRQWPSGEDWLIFPENGGAYSEGSSVDALLTILAKKVARYASKPSQIQMDAFYLLIHFNQGLLYNTPVETPFFKYEDAARVASEFISDDPGVFDKIFLLLAFEPGQRVFQLYPTIG